MLPTTFEDELQDCVLGQEAKRFPGSNKIIMIHNAVYRLLRAEVREQGGCREHLRSDEDRLNIHHLIFLASWQQGEGIIIITELRIESSAAYYARAEPS